MLKERDVILISQILRADEIRSRFGLRNGGRECHRTRAQRHGEIFFGLALRQLKFHQRAAGEFDAEV